MPDRSASFVEFFVELAKKSVHEKTLGPQIVAGQGFIEWAYLDSNRGPLRCQRSALTN
jgi:hypothetical protein